MPAEQYPKVYLYKRIVQAKLFIDQHYAMHMDVNNISDEASFSKFHFLRLFKKIYGKTPHQYLTRVRIERAMELLQNDIPVSEVCIAVGFESLSSFSGLFKRSSGVSPSQYVQQQKKRNTQMKQSPLDFIPGCFAEKNGWTKK